MTLVFLVRPKFSQPWDEQFFPCCIICSVLVLRAQLVIRKQDVSDDSLLLCSSLQAPEVEPARRQSCTDDRYSLLAVMEGISHHGWEYYTEERRSENTALFYAVRYWKVFWLVSVMSRTLTIMPSWNCLTVVMNLLGQPNFSFVFHKPSLLTVSKALVRSAKVTKRSLFYSWHFLPTVELETLVSL